MAATNRDSFFIRALIFTSILFGEACVDFSVFQWHLLILAIFSFLPYVTHNIVDFLDSIWKDQIKEARAALLLLFCYLLYLEMKYIVLVPTILLFQEIKKMDEESRYWSVEPTPDELLRRRSSQSGTSSGSRRSGSAPRRGRISAGYSNSGNSVSDSSSTNAGESTSDNIYRSGSNSRDANIHDNTEFIHRNTSFTRSGTSSSMMEGDVHPASNFNYSHKGRAAVHADQKWTDNVDKIDQERIRSDRSSPERYIDSFRSSRSEDSSLHEKELRDVPYEDDIDVNILNEKKRKLDEEEEEAKKEKLLNDLRDKNLKEFNDRMRNSSSYKKVRKTMMYFATHGSDYSSDSAVSGSKRKVSGVKDLDRCRKSNAEVILSTPWKRSKDDSEKSDGHVISNSRGESSNADIVKQIIDFGNQTGKPPLPSPRAGADIFPMGDDSKKTGGSIFNSVLFSGGIAGVGAGIKETTDEPERRTRSHSKDIGIPKASTSDKPATNSLFQFGGGTTAGASSNNLFGATNTGTSSNPFLFGDFPTSASQPATVLPEFGKGKGIAERSSSQISVSGSSGSTSLFNIDVNPIPISKPSSEASVGLQKGSRHRSESIDKPPTEKHVSNLFGVGTATGATTAAPFGGAASSTSSLFGAISTSAPVSSAVFNIDPPIVEKKSHKASASDKDGKVDAFPTDFGAVLGTKSFLFKPDGGQDEKAKSSGPLSFLSTNDSLLGNEISTLRDRGGKLISSNETAKDNVSVSNTIDRKANASEFIFNSISTGSNIARNAPVGIEPNTLTSRRKDSAKDSGAGGGLFGNFGASDIAKEKPKDSGAGVGLFGNFGASDNVSFANSKPEKLSVINPTSSFVANADSLFGFASPDKIPKNNKKLFG